MRFRKKDHAHNVQVAVYRWVRSLKGSVVVIGGVGLIDLGEYKYAVAVECTGKKPQKPKSK